MRGMCPKRTSLVSSKPIGLDWSAISTEYVEAGGQLRPEVWRADAPARKKQAYVPRSRPRPDRIPTGEPTGPARMLSDAQEKQILAEYEGGLSSLQLGKQYGVMPSTIRKIILRQGGTPRTKSEAMKISRSGRAQDV